MEHISIAIVSTHQDYSRALGLALIHVYQGFLIKLFCEDLSGVEQCDLILYDETVQPPDTANAVLLTEKPSLSSKGSPSGEYKLFKYAPAQVMVASIFQIYSGITGRKAVHVRSRSVRLLAFSSWAGGVGCSTLAMAVGQELTRFRGKKVLYVSFEEIESTGLFLACFSGTGDMNRYLYELLKDRGEARPFLEGYVVRDEYGMEAFAPTRGRNPLRDLKDEELCRVLASFIDSNRYDVILMDLGTQVSPMDLTCMEMAEKLCVIGCGKGMDAREERYFQHLICSCGEAVVEKAVRADNGIDTERKAEKLQEDGNVTDGENDDEKIFVTGPTIRVPHSTLFSREGSVEKISLEGDFGAAIHRLAEQMMEP